MKFPCELLAEPYLAQIRLQVTRQLREKRYTQSQIAELLQISQPVVSGYLKKSRNLNELPEEIVSRAISVATKISEILEEKGKMGTAEAINVACVECKVMRQYGPTCDYHRLITTDLGESCTACQTQSNLIQLQENKFGVLTDLSAFLTTLYSQDNIDRIIPEIGLQVVHSIPNPNSFSDIAAFPGRIIKRKGRNLIAENPIFGGSETMAGFLLDLFQQGLQLRTIVTLKTSRGLIDKISTSGYNHVIVTGLEEDFRGHISRIELNSPPIFIVGQDSLGFESITYLCTKDMAQLIDILNNLN